MPEILQPLPRPEIGGLSATELETAYRARTLSPVEATEAVLERVNAANGALEAFHYLDPEGALEAARAAERRWAEGAPLHGLDGVPVSVKAHIEVAGMPTVVGAAPRSWLDRKAAADEEAVARLRRKGAVLFGKTNSPEDPFTTASFGPNFGTARNPHDLARTAGGSSAGAGAAAAAGLGPIHIGSDTGGSVRMPAAYCGAIGFKPSDGPIPYQAPEPFPIHVYGPLCRTVRDCWLAFDAMAGADFRFPDPTSRFSGAGRSELSSLKVGVCHYAGRPALQPEQAVADAFQRSIDAIAGIGVDLIDVPPFLDESWWEPLALAIIPGGARDLLSRFEAHEIAAFSPRFRTFLEAATGVPAVHAERAHTSWQEALAQAPDPLQEFDLLLSPTTPAVAHGALEHWPEIADDSPSASIPGFYAANNVQTIWYNLKGQPALSLPSVTLPGALPAGLQIAGRQGTDALVLAFAAHIERELNLSIKPF